MTTNDPLGLGRVAYERRAWTEASRMFRAADLDRPLDIEDLDRLATAAHLVGDDATAVDAWSRAYHSAVRSADDIGAARLAFWLGMMLLQAGDTAQGGGWLSRAARLVEESGVDCAERGFLLMPAGLQQLEAGEPGAALETFEQMATIAERFDDVDLVTLGRLGRGRALIDLSRVDAGVAFLDEAMLAVTAGEASPMISGTVYCACIEAFQGLLDLRRAQDWTDALSAWCDTQPDLVPFRGRCLVYRAELLLWHGAWQEASGEARRAQELLLRPPPEPAVGEAYYLAAELHRLRGEQADAEAGYLEASRWGRKPEPGLALLRAEHGQRDAATAMIGRALGEAPDGLARALLLDAFVDIALAGGNLDDATAAASELTRLTTLSAVPLLEALATRVEGVVLLARGDAREALRPLRRAAALWQALDAPYESARVRVAIGQALAGLGDTASAALELDMARATLTGLGALPELARLDAIVGRPEARHDGLSRREVEVLHLIASGKTNRAIAAELGISGRTVDRHVSNIFAKIDVSSRSAATAYAYEHGLA